MVPTMRLRLGKGKPSDAEKWRLAVVRTPTISEITGKPVSDLGLKHWVRSTVPESTSSFGRGIEILKYTDEEYEQYLQEATWTREQTDRLFQLCALFGLRFTTIHDRFGCSGPCDPTTTKLLELEAEAFRDSQSDVIISQDKTMEDLKDRYYSIQKALLAARNSSDPELQRHLAFDATFDPYYETRRKEQLSRLLQRSKDSVSTMAELVLEHRRLTRGIKQLKRDQKNDRKHGVEPGAKVNTVSALSAQPVLPARIKVLEPTSGVAKIPEQCLATNVIPERHPGCFVRSTQWTTTLKLPGRNTNKLLEAELANMGVKSGKPTPVPSGRVCDLYDKLRADTVTYINLQQHLTKREAERDALKATSSNTLHSAPSAAYTLVSQSAQPTSYFSSSIYQRAGSMPKSKSMINLNKRAADAAPVKAEKKRRLA